MSTPEPDEEAREDEILRVARRLAPKQRADFLEKRCAGDAELRERIELMLAIIAADAHVEPTPAEREPREDSRIEGPGSTIGPYRLVERIGEGGFGVVFLAEQLEPIRRQVALKVIKPGMDTYQVIARFEAERQALAIMEHENIARVLDGGETATGRPYFVMELVRGARITSYCDQAQLSIPARLDLFASVCDAVQHAHQKGIIHRDLKPSNILVAESGEGKALVKVIDFGVAKAIGEQLTEKTLFSCFQMIGTPLYMSPEQAEIGGLDVDTRADVYALGVILYELMTGTTPLDRERMKQATLDEVRRIIREEEPAKPSSRLNSPGDDTSTVSANRGSDPLRLRRLLSGELDWIVLKCLEKDRSRRYATARDLAQDVRRFLANQPVDAGPPSVSYRLRKLFVRHRASVLTAAFMLLVLVGGIVGTTIGLIRAAGERERAKTAEADARVQRDHAVAAAESAQKRLAQIEKGVEILTDIFTDLTPDTMDTEGRTLREVLGERLQGAVKHLEGEAVGDPLVVARLQHKLADSLISLGYPERVIELLTRARTTLTNALGPQDRETIDCMVSLANAYRWTGKLDLALSIATDAQRLAEEHLGKDDLDTTIGCLEVIGLIHASQGHMDRALELFEGALALRKEVAGLEDPETIDAMSTLAAAYVKAGRIDQSIALAQDAIELGERYLGEDHSIVLAAMNVLATAYHDGGKPKLALPLQEQLWKRALTKLGPDHPWTRIFLGNLGSGYLGAGRIEEATAMLERAAEYLERIDFKGLEVHDLIENLEICLARLKRFDEAELWRRKVVAAEKKRGTHSMAYADALSALADTIMLRNQWSAAEPIFLERVEVLKGLVDEPEQSNLEPMLQVSGTTAQPVESAASTGDQPRARLIAAIQQLVQLYTAAVNDNEAAKWRLELEAARSR
jgi:serine/threonine protein kinase/tetratricopeptide (TPR) repeat protein